MRTFEIKFTIKTSTSSPMQSMLVHATDPIMARRIFEQQNPGCRIAGTPREIR